MYCLYKDARPVEKIQGRCGRCASVTLCAARRIQPCGWGFFSCKVQASRTRQKGIPSVGWGSLTEGSTTWFLWDWWIFHQWHRIRPCSWFGFGVSRWYSTSQVRQVSVSSGDLSGSNLMEQYSKGGLSEMQLKDVDLSPMIRWLETLQDPSQA